MDFKDIVKNLQINSLRVAKIRYNLNTDVIIKSLEIEDNNIFIDIYDLPYNKTFTINIRDLDKTNKQLLNEVNSN